VLSSYSGTLFPLGTFSPRILCLQAQREIEKKPRLEGLGPTDVSSPPKVEWLQPEEAIQSWMRPRGTSSMKSTAELVLSLSTIGIQVLARCLKRLFVQILPLRLARFKPDSLTPSQR